MVVSRHDFRHAIRIAPDHPLRGIRQMTHVALRELWTHFESLYARRGRPSIPPERLLMEQLDYNLLYRWLVGLNPDDKVWDVTVFTKNRERMMAGEVSQRY